MWFTMPDGYSFNTEKIAYIRRTASTPDSTDGRVTDTDMNTECRVQFISVVLDCGTVRQYSPEDASELLEFLDCQNAVRRRWTRETKANYASYPSSPKAPYKVQSTPVL